MDTFKEIMQDIDDSSEAEGTGSEAFKAIMKNIIAAMSDRVWRRITNEGSLP